LYGLGAAAAACCVPESLCGQPGGRRTEEGEHSSPKELYKAGNLTVFGSDSERDLPVQLDFHFKHGTRAFAHWHGLLVRRKLFLDTPHRALDVNSCDSLSATLDYAEAKTDVDWVFVNFHKLRSDRGDLLRAFGYLGFELVRPDHPELPPWEDVLFMAYPMEREAAREPE
uniref:Ornithine decarboxylase antizyme 3 n=1 Tax=Sphenodon punctatus TaxID=8508 RepID=A0A8D0G5Z3_SPHPU